MRLLVRPLERFLRVQAASGIILLVVACIALLLANSDSAPAYFALRETTVGIALGEWTISRSLEWIVNDILMTIFFFVVGMEIRREIAHGELSEWRRAALPLAAALGGMIAPALLYLALASGPSTSNGWGVPMATDIAFALGVLALLGKRVPAALRVLLLALAVIDDLGAILVIALFYSSGIQPFGLVLGALGVAGILLLQMLGVRAPSAYCAPGLVVWSGAYMAGLHPTIAGVIVGLLTPVRAWLGGQELSYHLTDVADELSAQNHQAALDSHAMTDKLRELETARREVLSPAERLIHALHPWVAYGIMPLFAFANAGVALDVGALGDGAKAVIAGVALGLVIGKPLGVVVASMLTVKLGLAVLPRGIGIRELSVLGLAAGIGFTMALFIAQLAFTDTALLAAAKLGTLAASCVAALLAVLAGFALIAPRREPADRGAVAESADEAESSTLS